VWREAVEDDGERPGFHLVVEVCVRGGSGGGNQQGVDLGQVDVVSDGAGVLGVLEKRADGSAQSVCCLSGVAVAVTTGVEERLGYGDLRCRVGDEVAKEVEERGAGIRGVEQRFGLLAEAIEPPDENGLQQRCLGGEVAEDRGVADSGQAGDLLRRCGLAALAEDLFGDVQDAAAVGSRIDASRPPTAGLANAWGMHRSLRPA
jgi:hypothetical protein